MSSHEYYDQYWTEAGYQPRNHLFLKPIHDLYKEFLPAGSTVVDVGCGDGRTSGPWLTENGYDYVGVDISAPAVRDASALGLKALVIDDATSLPFQSNSIDACVCIEVLEHLFAPQLAVKEIVRLLRPGGILIVTTPNVGYWKRRLELALLARWNPLGDDLAIKEPWRDPHIRFFSLIALERMLCSTGLEITKIGGHEGSLLRDTPWIGRRLWRGRFSPLYGRAESALPSLLGHRLHAVCRKPDG